jgi:hypothetical protein
LERLTAAEAQVKDLSLAVVAQVGFSAAQTAAITELSRLAREAIAGRQELLMAA